MKSNYLLPHKLKKMGWFILIPATIFGFLTLIFEYEPVFLDCNMPSIVIENVVGKTRYFKIENNNLLNEIFAVLIIIGGIMVAFSKEKIEDEYIAKIRLNSLVWAVYINYGILLLAILLVYDISFLWVMIFNMFTILWVFIIRFNYKVYKLKLATNEE